jgi:hypothetical protein
MEFRQRIVCSTVKPGYRSSCTFDLSRSSVATSFADKSMIICRLKQMVDTEKLYQGETTIMKYGQRNWQQRL